MSSDKSPHRGVIEETHGAYSLLRQLQDYNKLDGRTRLGKAVQQLEVELVRDLGGEPSVMQMLIIQSLIPKAIFVAVKGTYALTTEDMTQIDKHYVTVSNSLRHDLMSLGLEKRMKDVMDLQKYAEQQYGKPPEGESE